MVPDDTAAIVLTESMRDQPLSVPELEGARVGDFLERHCGRRSPIGGQNRLPDDQDADRLAGELP